MCKNIHIPITVAVHQEPGQSTREKGIVGVVVLGDVWNDDPFRLELGLQRFAPELVVHGRRAGRLHGGV